MCVLVRDVPGRCALVVRCAGLLGMVVVEGRLWRSYASCQRIETVVFEERAASRKLRFGLVL